MSRRPIAWMIFLGVLALVGAGGVFGIGTRALQYGIWGVWLVLTVGFVWTYARTHTPADQRHLIDTRGIHLLPPALRRWLFDS